MVSPGYVNHGSKAGTFGEDVNADVKIAETSNVGFFTSCVDGKSQHDGEQTEAQMVRAYRQRKFSAGGGWAAKKHMGQPDPAQGGCRCTQAACWNNAAAIRRQRLPPAPFLPLRLSDYTGSLDLLGQLVAADLADLGAARIDPCLCR